MEDAGEGVFGELREIEHGEGAVFLFHVVGLGVGARAARFEEGADGPGVGGEAGEFFFFGERAGFCGCCPE